MKVAVIPARGGSKRIPRKNIRDFCGLPMIAHSIAAARDCGLFDRIIVSTDDEEIAAVAREHGAEVPFMRPQELSGDYTGTIEVIAHATRWLLDQADGRPPVAVCCIYATAPMLLPDDIAAGWRELDAGDWSYAFSASEFAAPIFRSFKLDDAGGVEMFFPDQFNTRSQDLPVALHDAAQFYWGRPSAWLEGKKVFAPHSKAIILPCSRVVDIDTPADWHQAEMLYAARRLLGEAGA